MLKFMYITNNPDVAIIAEKNGVDRIWIDLETLGKEERQPGNTVKSHHSISDIPKIKGLLTKSELLVRINPWNENSKKEIDEVIAAGADIIMLPMWKTTLEVQKFLNAVAGRCKTTLLLETDGAEECLDEVLEKGGFDEIHIGLNDLHICHNKTFMFELLADGTVEQIIKKIEKYKVPYGFGGVGRIGEGLLKADNIIMEHYRLGSTRVILSRAFCNANEINDINKIDVIFSESIKKIRDFEDNIVSNVSAQEFEQNRIKTIESINEVVRALKGESDGN